MAYYAPPHPERHVNGVATVEVYFQFQVLELLWNEAVYYNVSAMFLK